MPETSSAKQLARLISYTRGRRLEFAASLTLVVLMAYTSGIIPMLIRNAVDKGLASRNLDVAVYYSVLIVVVAVLNGLFSFAGRILLVAASQHAVYRLRVEAFDSILRQGLEFFNKTMTGQLISRITNDAERITGFLSFRLRMLVYSAFLIAVSLYYMARMNMLLTLIASLTILAAVSINYAYARRIRPVYDRIRHRTGVLASIASGTLAGIRTVKALTAEEYAYQNFDEENAKLFGLSVRASRINAVYGNSPFLVIGMAMSAMLYYGGRAILHGTLTVGELVAFLTYMLTLMWPLRALGFILGDVQRSLAAATRLFEIIDAAPQPAEGEVELGDIRGEVEARDVWFTYDTDKTALRGVSLHVRPGEKVVIIGPPGSGKSTLLKVIAGLYRPERGEVLIDGIPVEKIKRSSLRRIIAYVPQEPFIFDRSIRDNIALWDPRVSEEDIVRAAKIARIHDTITRLPKGYDTIVGERGVTLSGGQRQRIAIARALARNPRILLLDDPVSNLDAETEEALVRDLREALRGRTAIIVSQRPSLARIADRVVYLVDGRVEWEGPPSGLLEQAVNIKEPGRGGAGSG